MKKPNLAPIPTLTLNDLAAVVLTIKYAGPNRPYPLECQRFEAAYKHAADEEHARKEAAPDKRKLKALRYILKAGS
jgi:hypothetical protein